MRKLDNSINLKFLGTRGSVPVSGKDYMAYGCATSCIKVTVSKDGVMLPEEIYLDAGNGILSAETGGKSRISVLLSHLHLDHVLGLPMFPPLNEKGRKIDIYLGAEDEELPEKALDRLIAPPFWPCSLQDYAADVTFRRLAGNIGIAGICVNTMEIPHPGGARAIKLSLGDASIVYATDFEHLSGKTEELSDFSRGAILLIYDGQYTAEEYELHRGYGHSTPEKGLEIAEAAEVGRVIFTHHSPYHTDSFIREWEKDIQGNFPFASFAREGETVTVFQ